MSGDNTGPEVSLQPHEGWHCTHLFYRFERSALVHLNAADFDAGRR
jgi:hypothetical protein